MRRLAVPLCSSLTGNVSKMLEVCVAQNTAQPQTPLSNGCHICLLLSIGSSVFGVPDLVLFFQGFCRILLWVCHVLHLSPAT